MAESFIAEFDDQEVKEFLRAVDKNLKNIKDGHRKYTGLLSAIVYQDIMEHFENEAGSNGPWKQWSKFHRERMQEIGKGGNKILQDSGRLRNNFKPTKVKKTKEGFLWFNDAKTKKGFPYAAAHDNGGSKLPKRDFMWLSEKAMGRIEIETLQFMLDEGV
jgi:phage gpG-like protein